MKKRRIKCERCKKYYKTDKPTSKICPRCDRRADRGARKTSEYYQRVNKWRDKLFGYPPLEK